MLVVDSGDLFFRSQLVAEPQLAHERAQAELIVDIYNRVGCDALNVGDRDLAAGREVIEALRKRAEFPFISANILDPKTQRPVFTPHVVARVAGQRVGILGLLTTRTRLGQLPGSEPEFEIGDPVEAAKAAVAALKKQRVATIILLSQLLDDEVAAVIEAAPEIDIVFGSQNPSFVNMLGEIAGRPHVTSQMRGQHLGVLSLFLQRGSRGVVERNRAQSMVGAIENIDRRIRQQEMTWARFAERPGVQAQRIAYFKQDIERQLAERGRLVAQLAKLEPADPKRSFVEFELVPLGRQVEDDTAIKKLVDDFKAGAARAGRHVH